MRGGMLPINVPPAYTALCAKTAQLRLQCLASTPSTPASLVAEFMKAHEEEMNAGSRDFDLGEFVVTTTQITLPHEVILAGTMFSITRDLFGKVAEFRNGQRPITRRQKYAFGELEKNCRLLEVSKEERKVQRDVLELRLELAGFQKDDHALGTVLLGLIDAGLLDAALLPKLAEDVRSETSLVLLLGRVAARKAVP